MTDVWFYVFLVFVGFEILIHFFRERIEEQEERFLKEVKLVFVTPDTFSLFLSPVVALILALFFTSIFQFKSGAAQFLSIVLISGACILFFLAMSEYIWLHYFEDKIILRYPLRRKTVEIPLVQITQVGFKHFVLAKGDHYFIEFKSGKKKKYIAYTGVGIESQKLREYFSTRQIEFSEITI